MHESLAQLMAYLKATWRRRWYIIIIAWLVSIAGWTWVYTLPDRYEASARVFVDTQSLLRPLLSGLAVQPNFDQQVSMMTRTLISRPNLEKVARMTDLDIKAKTPAETEDMLNGLASQIQISSSGGNNLYTIAYQNKNPDLAKRVVQSLLTIFVESSLGGNRKDLAHSQKFIEEQLKGYEQKLIAAESALKDFKRQHIGIMPGQGGDYYAKLTAAATVLNQAKLELKEAENRRDQLKRQLSDEEPDLSSSLATGNSNPEIDSRIKDLEKQLDALRLRFTEEHPDVVGTKRIIAQLEEQKKQEAATRKPGSVQTQTQNPVRQQLTIAFAEAEASIASFNARVAEYQNRYNELKAASDRIPQVEADFTQLTRDYEVYKSNYEGLLSRRESVAMSGEVEAKGETVDFRVVDPPRVPLNPAWPNRPLMMALVMLGGIAAGIVVAFLVSQIRRTVDDRHALREVSGRPLLGVINMISTVDTSRKNRKKLFAYALSFMSLLGTFGVLILLQLLMARAA